MSIPEGAWPPLENQPLLATGGRFPQALQAPQKTNIWHQSHVLGRVQSQGDCRAARMRPVVLRLCMMGNVCPQHLAGFQEKLWEWNSMCKQSECSSRKEATRTTWVESLPSLPLCPWYCCFFTRRAFLPQEEGFQETLMTKKLPPLVPASRILLWRGN